MLKDIGLALDNLDVLLDTLWLNYLDTKPETWLRYLKHVTGELGEARELRDEIGELQTHLGYMQHRLKHAHAFDPVRKEN